jgi:putative two-component system response regulator
MKKILMVDDEDDQIFTARIILESEGEYTLIGANSGEQCFELLKNGELPDVILLDIMMPGMSGWKVHDELKKRSSPWKHIPIIFLTGTTDLDSKEVGGWFGEDFIEKPYEVTDLKNRIKKVLEKEIKA